uniref:Alpha/beta hydrolase fold-3 domain-containing protein n=1 Tax=Pseudonaja textilis TaxID=8673 RepID=A0A670Z0R3_PSETE
MGGEKRRSACPYQTWTIYFFWGSAAGLSTASTGSLAEEEENLPQVRRDDIPREAPGLPSCCRRHVPGRLPALGPYPVPRNRVSSWDRSTPEGPHLPDDELGLCTFPNFLRLWTNGIPPRRDLSLVIRNEKFDGVPVRIYSSRTVPAMKRKAVLYFHGGAGIFGSIGKATGTIPSQARTGDATVVAVGYGLGPENPYPNQYIECLKAAVYLMKHGEDYGVDSSRIIISGDSCGANFATRICQLLVDRRDLPKVHAQALIYPGLQALNLSLPSYQQNCRSPFLWSKLVTYFCCRYLNKSTSFANDLLKGSHVPKASRVKYRKWVNADSIPERFKVRGYTEQDHSLSNFNPQLHEEMKELLSENISPLLAEDAVVCKLPQTFLLTCEYDVLRDDGLLYMKRLMDNGVPVTWSHVENGMHAIMRGTSLFHLIPKTQRIWWLRLVLPLGKTA